MAGAVGFATFYRGLAIGAMGVVAPIAAAGAALPVAVGIATGDRPSGWQGAGIALAIVGVCLAARERSVTETSTTLIVGALVGTRRGVSASVRDIWALVAVGLLDGAGTTLYAASSGRGLVSIVSVLASLYPVTIVVLARFLLGERISPPQLVGVAGALAGVALISAG